MVPPSHTQVRGCGVSFYGASMKWFKMDCDAQDNLDMRNLVDVWGWEWYGRYFAILGKVGMLVTERTQTFALQTNNGSPFPVRLLANDLGTTVERLSDFCGFLADNRLIDKDSWYSKNLIYVPKLRERADEYTNKLLTKSRHSPEQEVEEEVEVEQKKKKTRDIPPPMPDVVEYFSSLGIEEEAPVFYDHYQTNGWVQGRQGKPVKDWKAAARNWKRNMGRYGNGSTLSGKNRQGDSKHNATQRGAGAVTPDLSKYAAYAAKTGAA